MVAVAKTFFAFLLFAFPSAAAARHGAPAQGVSLVHHESAAPKSIEDGLVSVPARRRLRGLIDDFARLGLAHEVMLLRRVLLLLGDTEEQHAKLLGVWERELGRATPQRLEIKREILHRNLSRSIRDLESELLELDPPRASELAELLLELDSESGPAHAVLGHTNREGLWLGERALAWQAGALRVAELVRRAGRLEVEVVHAPSRIPAAISLYGANAHHVSAQGLHLHAGMAPKKLERILISCLRAMALSAALLGGELELPTLRRSRHMLLLSEQYQYEVSLADALAGKSVSGEEYERQLTLKLSAFTDQRGWRVCGWRTESDFEALLLSELSDTLVGRDAQPCFVGGHLNWICINLFGTSLPAMAWSERWSEGERSSAERQLQGDPLWFSATKSLYGCRAWIKAHMREGKSFPFVRAIVDQIGKLVGEPLLKATLVNEYLQASGELAHLIDATRGRVQRVEAIEEALGRSLPELEAEWSSWLFAESPEPGLLQGLAEPLEPVSAERALLDAFLTQLQFLRETAFGTSIAASEGLELIDELSDQARAHAHYLGLNPEQGHAWPDAHEEFPGRPGRTPGGAWAGRHSVIHFTSDPMDALEGWMASFYHRLPLLEPGLFGIGFGQQGDVIVLDTGSLVRPYWANAWVVWPSPNAIDIPTMFRPEIPNPIPGADQSAWGYPISLQAFWGSDQREHSFAISLHEGDSISAEEVPCHYISPSAPAFDKLAPKEAYCLIPKEHLKPGQNYTVQARCLETEEELVWNFRTGF